MLKNHYVTNKWIIVLVTILVSVVILAGTPGSAYTANSDLIISEIAYFPGCPSSGICSSTSQTDFEWVEIFNKGTASVDINGWKICNKSPGSNHANCDTIASTSTVILSGSYWVIANSNSPTDYLQQEFNLYPGTPSVNDAQTLYLNAPIGLNGIEEIGDAIFIVTNETTCGGSSNLPCVSDCVSWDVTATCSALVDDLNRAYLSGSDGVDDSSLNYQARPGQSLVNVSGVWAQHGPIVNGTNQASPYAANTNESGTTAITLSNLTARNSAFSLLLLASILFISTGAFLILRRRTRKQEI